MNTAPSSQVVPLGAVDDSTWEGDLGMRAERHSEDIAAAWRFVERLAALPATARQPVLAPLLDVDPYLSAWINVEAALHSAPSRERERRLDVASELDRKVDAVDLTPEMAEAARRAVRAILARPWLLTAESLTFVYEPFQAVIPIATLT